MEVLVKEVDELSPEEFKQCYSLNLRDIGYMRDTLIRCKNKSIRYKVYSDRPAKIVMVKDKDTVLGWSIAYPNAKGYYAHFYVRAAHRRKGYGTILLKKVRELDPDLTVFPHDKKSGAFFNKHPIQCSPSVRKWLDV